MTDHADIVFINGRVLIMDQEDSVDTALAIKDGSVCARGRDAEALAGAATRVIDMNGGTLLPGINDSHCHAVTWGMASPPLTLDVSYPAVSSIADIVAVVEEAVRNAEPGEWIVGGGWDLGFLEECLSEPGRQPTRWDLDAISPDNPVLLGDFSYHTAWVNSETLRLADIGAAEIAQHPSLIPTNDAGESTGILYEGVMHTVSEMLPKTDHATRRFAAELALQKLNALGITSITEPALGIGDATGGMAQESLDVYEELRAEGLLSLRVSVLLFPIPMDKGFDDFKANLDATPKFEIIDPRLLNITGVKIFADGIPPNKTSWMHEPYVTGGTGALTIPGDTIEEKVEQLFAMVEYGHRLGHQVGIHVTGDRGIDAVVDAFAAAVDSDGRTDSRHYVIHGDFMTRHSLDVCRRYNFGVNMNPTIKWTIADLEKEFVGPERAAYEWPYRDALDAGVIVASSSDAPVTAPDWRQGVATMITRKSKATGEVSGPDQAITLFEALRTYTAAGAWQDFAETWKGTLDVGMVADLCLVRQDLLSIDPDDIPSVDVALTVLDGRVIFEA
ncbi:MAG: amidohydrolase [Thermoleophilia bacterium]|nr:amidohydrolase [Thermoleophilia bacterium]